MCCVHHIAIFDICRMVWASFQFDGEETEVIIGLCWFDSTVALLKTLARAVIILVVVAAFKRGDRRYDAVIV